MLPLLRALSLLPLVLAARLRREERRLVEWFRARGALDPERAVMLSPGGAVHRFVQHRLEGAGAIRAARDRFYFDETSYTAFRSRRRKRAMIVVTVVVIGLGIAFLTGVIQAMALGLNQSPKDVPRISISELKTLTAKKQAIVVDVRDKSAFAAGHIPGAINIVFDDIPNYVEKLAKDKRVIVTYCA